MPYRLNSPIMMRGPQVGMGGLVLGRVGEEGAADATSATTARSRAPNRRARHRGQRAVDLRQVFGVFWPPRQDERSRK